MDDSNLKLLKNNAMLLLDNGDVRLEVSAHAMLPIRLLINVVRDPWKR